MPDDSSRSPRRRPVDVLFGEEVELKPKPTNADADTRTPQAPGYMVEMPRPVTSVRPPPPEFPNDWSTATPPEVVAVVEPAAESAPVDTIILPPPAPVMPEPPRVEPIAEAVTFTLTERSETPPPFTDEKPLTPAEPVAPVPAPVGMPAYPAPAPLYGQTELVELSQFVDQLYQNVAEETSDSAALNAECLARLNTARRAIEKRDYVRAETEAEWVKARLLRARSSRASAGATVTRVLFAWLVVALVGGLVIFLVPVFARLVPSIIPLVRAAGLGLLGGAVSAAWQLSRHIAAREHDAAFNLRYAASPLVGAVLGAVMFLLSLLGIVAAPNALEIPGEPWLMYLFAFLAGLFGDRLLDIVLSRRPTSDKKSITP